MSRRPFLLAPILAAALAAPAAAQVRLEEPRLEPGAPLREPLRRALEEALAERARLLGDEVYVARPAHEARERLAALAARMPKEAAVQRYLSRAALADGDALLAEQAAQREVALAPALPQALWDLADLQRARSDARAELQALDRLIELLERRRQGRGGGQPLVEELGRALARAEAVARGRGLPEREGPLRYEQALVDLHPDDPSYLRRHLDRLLQAALRDRAADPLFQEALRRYRARWPHLLRDLLRAEAALPEARGDIDGAVAVYEKALAPAPAVAAGASLDVDGVFSDLAALLRRQGRDRQARRALEARARSGAKVQGYDLALLLRLLEQGGQRKEALALLRGLPPAEAAAERLLRARLLLRLSSPAEAIPALYGAYRAALAEGGAPLQVEALSDLGHALLIDARLSTALTPLSALSAYSLRRGASGPSILGGLLSLLFSGRAGPDRDRAAADLQATTRALGNGARAVEIYRALRQAARALTKDKDSAAAREGAAGLLAEIVELHRAYKDYGEASRLAAELRREHPSDGRYFDVGLAGCDADLRRGADFSACLRGLLDEASRRGDRPAYDRVLSQLVEALGEKRRGAEVVRLFWAEIGKSDDPALYERFLSYLSARNLHDEELRVYERARAQLPEGGFAERLARLYLRWRGQAALDRLLPELIKSLDGEGAARLLRARPGMEGSAGEGEEEEGGDGAAPGRPGRARLRAFYLELHRRAAARFPLDMELQAELLRRLDEDARERGGRDGAEAGGREAQRIVKQLCVADPARPEARARLLKELRGDGLDGALAALAKEAGDAARIVRAQLLVQLSRQEEALPLLAALRERHPHDLPLLLRHGALIRAAAQPDLAAGAARAASLLLAETGAHPAEPRLLEEAGDYLAEAGQLPAALGCFARIPSLTPGDPEAWLRLASIQWDYYRYAEAAASIEEARRRGGDPRRLGEKLAAVYESRGDMPAAIAEYVRILAQDAVDQAAGRAAALRVDDEGGEEGGEVAGDSGGAARRLLRLSRRGKGPLIDAAFQRAFAERQRDPRGPGVVLSYAAHLRARGDEARRRRFLTAEALPRLQDLPALAQLGDDSDVVVRVAARRRLAQLSGGAPEPTRALVEVLAASGDRRGAEAELRALLARLTAPEDRSEAVDAEQRLARLLWEEAPRREGAVAVLLSAAERAAPLPGARRDRLLLEAARWQEALGRADGAEAGARAALGRHPGELEYVEALAALRWRRGDRAGALGVYRAELAALGRPAAGAAAAAGADRPAQRPRRAAELRRRIVERLIARLRDAAAAAPGGGEAREAVELWLQAAGERPERPDVEALYEAARLAGLGARVRDYFEKTHARSPKDARWPTVLAWLAWQDGDAARAAARYAEALAVAPERLDLREAHAEALGLAGDFVAAARASGALYELSDHDRRHAGRQIEWLALGGRRDEALAVQRALLDREDEPARLAEEAERLRRVGLRDDALRLAEDALVRAAAGAGRRPLPEEAARLWAQLSVEAGRGAEALPLALRLEAQARARAESPPKGDEGEDRGRADATAAALAAAADRHLPEALGEGGTSADLAALIAAARRVAAEPARAERAAQLLARAGLHEAAQRLASERVASPAKERLLLRELEETGRYGEAAALAERTGALPRAAILYRREGEGGREAAALQRLLVSGQRGPDRSEGFGPFRPEAGRLLELDRDLAGAGAWSAAGPAAPLLERRGPLLAQAATQLLLDGGARRERGLGAFDALFPGAPRPLLAARRGLALLALGEPRRAAALLGPALSTGEAGVGPIEQILARSGSAALPLSRRAELGLYLRTGEALALGGGGGAALLAGAVEDRPADPAAHREEGDVLWLLGRRAEAREAYGRARALAPRDEAALDRLARAAWALGQRDEALRLFDEPLGWARPGLAARDEAEAEHLRRLADTGAPELAARGAERYEAYLMSRARALEPAALLEGVAALARARRDLRPSAPFDRFVRALLPASGGAEVALLERLTGVGGREALLQDELREPFLRRGVELAAAPTRAAFREELAAWGLRRGRPEVALALTEALTARPGGDGERERWPGWLLTRAEALCRAGRPADARALLLRELGLGGSEELAPQERVGEAAAMLARLGRRAEADELLVASYRRRGMLGLSSGETAALGAALTRRGERAEAALLLRRLALRPGEAAAATATAAELGLLDEAERLSRALLLREPARAALRLDLGRLRLRAGDGAGAAAEVLGALALPARRALGRAGQGAAADLLEEIGRKGAVPAAALLGRLPGDEDETLLLIHARLGDAARLRAAVDQRPSPLPSRARALRLLAERALLSDRAAEALADGRAAAAAGGLTPALRALCAEAAARAGRHALAVGLAEPPGGDPLREGGASGLSERTARSDRAALLQLVANSAAEARLPAARLRLLREAAAALRRGPAPDLAAAARLDGLIRSEAATLAARQRRERRLLVTRDLQPAAFAPPAPGPLRQAGGSEP